MSLIASSHIGKIAYAKHSYYNIHKRRNEFKSRPVLIINTEKSTLPCDLTLLPISKISRAENISGNFDVKIEGEKVSLLGLSIDPSYIRTHKTFTSHSMDVSISGDSKCLREIDIKLYEEVEKKHSEFNSTSFR